ncbi:hypothetical protein ACFPK1_12665 [Actinomycetospora rhizophila]|uniref:DUF3040 family protein n=1 Tax=Actinomycetospora rhizophila TaxID=1416876 RepID=A0ABV9ZDD3_9PSEU
MSEQEKDAFARLEASLRDDDAPDRGPEGTEPARRRTGPRPRDLVIQVVVVAVLAVALMPSAWLAGLVVAIVMLGPTCVAIWAMRRGML